MALQEIADCAMEYLGSKYIPAEYEIDSGIAVVFFNGLCVKLSKGLDRVIIKYTLAMKLS